MATIENHRVEDFAAGAAGRLPSDATELAAGLAGQAVIAGRAMPAPSAGAVALLDALDSPFVSAAGGRTATAVEIARAIYVVAQQREAALPALVLMRRREALAGAADAAEGELAEAVQLGMRRELAEAEAEFDAKAVAFLDALGPVDLRAAAAETGAYLALASGFRMLPEEDEKKKAPANPSST